MSDEQMSDEQTVGSETQFAGDSVTEAFNAGDTQPVNVIPVPVEPVTTQAPAVRDANQTVRDLTKHCPGTFDSALLSGAPADAVKRLILTRVGVGPGDKEMAGIADVRLDFLPARDGKGLLREPDVARVPSPFPPEGAAPGTAAEWLALVDSCKTAPGG